MCGKKKGNRRRTTLILLNADAKALCLRPDPELVKVFGIPRRRRYAQNASVLPPLARFLRGTGPWGSSMLKLGLSTGRKRTRSEVREG